MAAKRNTSKHLDKWVIYVFIAAFFLSATTLAFKYVNNVPCEDIAFNTEAREYRVGELIKFIDYTTGAETWEWDFGDNSDVKTRKEPIHIYNEPGEYTIKLRVNNVCERTETVVIKNKIEELDSTKIPVFQLPESIMVGKTLKVQDETNNASTWEWRFGETAKVNATTQNAEYEYQEPGLKTVTLVVNGDVRHIGSAKINVLPRPGDKTPITDISKPKRPLGWNLKDKPTETVKKEEEIKQGPSAPKATPYINNMEFGVKLKQLADEKLKAQAFADFFCNKNLNTQIIHNGKSKPFLVYLEEIKGKKLKVKSVNLIRDPGSNCIKTATINSKKGWL